MNRLSVVLLASLACAGCAYVGDPQPPALNLPERVADLSAVERGSQLQIQFTMPVVTTEGLPIKETPEAEVRIGTTGPKFDLSSWIEGAKALPDQGNDTHYRTPAAPWIGHDVAVAVRLKNSRGRDGGWSNFVVIPVVEPLEKPEQLRAELNPSGMALSWFGAGNKDFRVFRKEETGEFAPVADVSTNQYLDSTAQFGKTYQYYVQGIRKVGEKTAESEPSKIVTRTLKDEFPPAVPSHVTAVVGPKSIELSWDRDTESDLGGYRLYRAEGDGEFRLVGDKLAAPSYSDRSLKSGTKYRYSVTAYDLSGNESGRSAVAEAAAQ